MSKPFRLLISGGGITGPVIAFWLAKAKNPTRPIRITMIERASAVLKLGQGIDVEGPAKQIVERMGLLDIVKSRTTGEKGMHCIDNDSRPYAIFEQGGWTQEIEIMRGELCEVLTSAVRREPNVELQYQRQITNIEQSDGNVRVTIAPSSGQPYTEEYDAVVASDGLRSKTRDLILGAAETEGCIKSIDMYAAYFSIPAQPQDLGYSRMQHALRGRSVVIRPVTESISSVYLLAVGKHPVLAKSHGDRDPNVKRQAWAETIQDLGYGEFPRAREAVLATDNFYSDQISQVKLSAWSKGRCALVGDAAWAPSPVTGQGTQLAILGAYVLAGELAKNLDEPAKAFKEYDKKLRSYVEKQQQIPLGGKAPALMQPQSQWGIWILQSLLWAAASSRVWKLIPDLGEESFKVPDYDFR